jgi:hypothetical protein
MVLSVTAIRASTIFDSAAYFSPRVTTAERAQLLSVAAALRTDAGCFAGLFATSVKLTNIYDVALDRGDFWYYAGDPVNAPLAPSACPSVGPAVYPADGARPTRSPSPSPAEARRLARRASAASTVSHRPRGGHRARLLAATSNQTGVDVTVEFSLLAPAFNASLARLIANLSAYERATELFAEFDRQTSLQEAASKRLETFINELVTPPDVDNNPPLSAFFRNFLRECAARLNVEPGNVTLVIKQPAVAGPIATREGPEPDSQLSGGAAQGYVSAAAAVNGSIGGVLGFLTLLFSLFMLLLLYRRRRRRRAQSDKVAAGVVIGCVDNPMRQVEQAVVEKDDDAGVAPPAPVVVEEAREKPEPQSKGHEAPDLVMGFGLGGSATGGVAAVVANPMAQGSRRTLKTDTFRVRTPSRFRDDEVWADERREHGESNYASRRQRSYHSSRHNNSRDGYGAAPADRSTAGSDAMLRAHYYPRHYYADRNHADDVYGRRLPDRAAGSERRQPTSKPLPTRAAAPTPAPAPQRQQPGDDASSGDESVRRMSISTYDPGEQAEVAAAAAAAAMVDGLPEDVARSRAGSSMSSPGAGGDAAPRARSLSPRAEALLAAVGSRPASVAGPPLIPRA